MNTTDLLQDINYGYSTGWDPTTRLDYGRAVEDALRFSSGSIELSALSINDLPLLLDFLGDKNALARLKEFRSVSVHGPAKHLVDDWQPVVDVLRDLPSVVERIVLHPDTLPGDPSAFAAIDGRLVLENMDCRKQGCRTAAEMQGVLAALPAAGFCLDVAHSWTVDPTLVVGEELLDAYGDRLVEVHLSGVHANGKHRVTTPADVELYWPLLRRCRAMPWIFESPLVAAANTGE